MTTPEPERMRQAYPFLVSKDDTAKKGAALASLNIRKWLRHVYPDVGFSVRLDRYSGGTTVIVQWTRWPDAITPSRAEVDALLRGFQQNTFDGMTDSTLSDQDPTRRQFRELFGGTSYLRVEGYEPTAEAIAERQRQVLKQELREQGGNLLGRNPRKRARL